MLFLPLLLAAGLTAAFPQHGGHGGPPGGPPGGGHSTGTWSTATWSGHSTATASGGHGGPTFSGAPLPWAPPGEGDVRSPCPALNTLANHYLLPHSGKNITTADIISAFAIGQNFAADTVSGAAAGALALCSNETGTTCTSFDLDMLDKPHAIEHDGSLSREDYNYGKGDNHDFNPYIWGQVLRIWGHNEIIDFSLANAARLERVNTANATDAPGWFVPAIAQGLFETAFYLSLFGDPVAGNARADWINVWFFQERMPFELGWNATQRTTITSASLQAMVPKISAA